MQKIKMGSVKFTPKMEPITPIINMGVVMDICNVLSCNNSMEIVNKIAGCTGAVPNPDKTSKQKTIDSLVDQNTYLNIAIDLLFESTKAACEVAEVPVLFERKHVKSKITMPIAQDVLLWFMQEIKELLEIEGGNEPGTIHIT